MLCGVFYGIGSIGIWLYNKIDSGDCIWNWSAWDYCVIDSILLTLLATIGATAAATMVKTAIRELGLFVVIMGKIMSSSNEKLHQLTQEALREEQAIHHCGTQAEVEKTEVKEEVPSTSEPESSPTEEPEVKEPIAKEQQQIKKPEPEEESEPASPPPRHKQRDSYTCDWTGRVIYGKKITYKEYMKENSGYTKEDIKGFFCTNCGKFAVRGADQSGIKFHWWHGFDKSVCKACGAEAKKPDLVV